MYEGGHIPPDADRDGYAGDLIDPASGAPLRELEGPLGDWMANGDGLARRVEQILYEQRRAADGLDDYDDSEEPGYAPAVRGGPSKLFSPAPAQPTEPYTAPPPPQTFWVFAAFDLEED